MLIANYHTHTPRCLHAEGTEEQYIAAAMESGMKILGFSDHAPQWFREDYYSNMRMYPHKLPEYCDTIRKFQKKHAGQLDILLGVEAEYYPTIFGDLLKNLRDNGVQYMILGQHWAGHEIGETYSGRPNGDAAQLQRHCRQTMDAINTGLFTYIAHSDTFNFTGDPKTYDSYIRPLCREAKACGIPLEINLLGLGEGRHYPNPRFWQIAEEENCDCVIGFDAHRPNALRDLGTYEKALQCVRKYGLKLLDSVPLRSLG